MAVMMYSAFGQEEGHPGMTTTWGITGSSVDLASRRGHTGCPDYRKELKGNRQQPDVLECTSVKQGIVMTTHSMQMCFIKSCDTDIGHKYIKGVRGEGEGGDQLQSKSYGLRLNYTT